MSNDKVLLRGRLNGSQRNRLGKLLDMMYTPSELAQEVGFNKRQIYRVYIPCGCPHERDDQRRIWINGKEFREWAKDAYKKHNLLKDEAFCLTCRKPVPMTDPIRERSDKLIYDLSDCPYCGRRLARIIDRKRKHDDLQR